MELEAAILLLDIVNRGIDTGLKMKFAVDKIMGMTPEEVAEANKSEKLKTRMLLEIAHQI